MHTHTHTHPHTHPIVVFIWRILRHYESLLEDETQIEGSCHIAQLKTIYVNY